MAGLGGWSAEETVTSSEVIADTTRKKKRESKPSDLRPESFSNYVQISATQISHSSMFMFNSTEITKEGLRGEKKNHLNSTSGHEYNFGAWGFGKMRADWPGWKLILGDVIHSLLKNHSSGVR